MSSSKAHLLILLLLFLRQCLHEINLVLFLFHRYHALQRRNPNAVLKLPDTQNNIDVATNEPVVGGVYLRLFIASPAWALRKPKEFLSELMDTTLTLMSKDKTDVSVTNKCLM